MTKKNINGVVVEITDDGEVYMDFSNITVPENKTLNSAEGILNYMIHEGFISDTLKNKLY